MCVAIGRTCRTVIVFIGCHHIRTHPYIGGTTSEMYIFLFFCLVTNWLYSYYFHCLRCLLYIIGDGEMDLVGGPFCSTAVCV